MCSFTIKQNRHFTWWLSEVIFFIKFISSNIFLPKLSKVIPSLSSVLWQTPLCELFQYFAVSDSKYLSFCKSSILRIQKVLHFMRCLYETYMRLCMKCICAVFVKCIYYVYLCKKDMPLKRKKIFHLPNLLSMAWNIK